MRTTKTKEFLKNWLFGWKSRVRHFVTDASGKEFYKYQMLKSTLSKITNLIVLDAEVLKQSVNYVLAFLIKGKNIRVWLLDLQWKSFSLENLALKSELKGT